MSASGSKDQTFCPKCGRMYCEGFWGEGVCIADMHFSHDPTACGDEIASYVRQWYEVHRESWWGRNRFSKNQALLRMGVADSFMLAFINEVARVERAAVAKRRGPPPVSSE